MLKHVKAEVKNWGAQDFFLPYLKTTKVTYLSFMDD